MMRSFDVLREPLARDLTVLEASAGTGKTYTIAALVARYLLEQPEADIRRLVVITYTNAATDELRSRIRSLLEQLLHACRNGDETEEPLLLALLAAHDRAACQRRLQRALLDFDEAMISTIHGFCARLLQDCALSCGLPFEQELLGDDNELRLEAAYQAWRELAYQANDCLAAVLHQMQVQPAALLPHVQQVLRHPDTEVQPRQAELEPVLMELQQQLDLVASIASDADGCEGLQAVDLNASSPLAAAGWEHVLGCLRDARRQPEAALAVARWCTPEALEQARNKRRKNNTIPEHPLPAAAEALQRAMAAVHTAFIAAAVARIPAYLHRSKRQRGVLAFDDLLRLLHDALEDPDNGAAFAVRLRHRFDLALIDEFQDTDPLQARICRKLFAGRPCYCIGDPKQAIYAFRGADIHAYLDIRGIAADSATLAVNFRSHQDLLIANQALYGHARRPFLEAGIDFPSVTAGKDLQALEDPGSSAAWQWWYLPPAGTYKNGRVKTHSKQDAYDLIWQAISAEIVRLCSEVRMDGRPLRPSDCAVLVRRHAHAEELRARLRQAGVNAVLHRSGSILTSHEMQELELLIQAVAQPGRVDSVCTARACDLFGGSETSTVAMAEVDTWLSWSEKFQHTQQHWQGAGALPALQALLRQEQVRPRLAAMDDGERRLCNLDHALELLHHAAMEGRGPQALVQWLRRERLNPSLGREQYELRLASEADAVSLVTIHAAKGLQYPVVFCPGLWEGPSAPSDHEPVWCHAATGPVYDLGGPDLVRHQRARERDDLAEELRLCYVALTRAERRCYVVHGAIGSTADRSALSYLLEQPQTNAEDADWMQQVRASCSLDVTAMQAHCQRSGTAAGCCELPRIDDLPRLADTAPAVQRQIPTVMLRHEQLHPWRVTSFSGLTSGLDGEHLASDEQDREPLESGGDLFGFARGPGPGTCLHELLEHGDFARIDDQAHQAACQETLDRYGLLAAQAHPDCDDPPAAVQAMLRRLCQRPLPLCEAPLAAIARSQRLDEWAFHLPLRQHQPQVWQSLIAQYGDARLQEYAPALQHLGREQLAGFLRGFIDLFFVHQERWYLIDWKSNHLGSRFCDYDEANMHRAMCEHHYYLQALIYQLAAHRFLSARLSDYDPERHLGGAAYVFLRGIDANQQQTGIISMATNLPLLLALEQTVLMEVPA